MPRLEKVRFDRGTKDSMPVDIVPGTLLFQSDTGDVFLDDEPDIRVQLGDSRKLPLTGGTLQGDLSMGGHKLTNLSAPTNNGDAVTKQYVDSGNTSLSTQLRELEESLKGYLPLTGGTLTGNLNLSGNYLSSVKDPVAAQDAATKNYVDTKASGYLPLSGGTMTGSINMSQTKITGLANPTADSDAAHKKYVDDLITTALTPVNQTLGEHDRHLTSIDDRIEQISGDIIDPKTLSDYLKLSGGTMVGALSMGDCELTDLVQPTRDNDAATKLYVDQQASVAGDGKFLPLAGGTLSGELSLSNKRIKAVATPVEPTDAVNKSYVDDAVSGGMGGAFLPTTGGIMTGSIQMSENRILQLPTPESGDEAANKDYVDDCVKSVESKITTSTTYEAGDHIVIEDRTISHQKTGEARPIGDKDDVAPESGGSFTVPYITIDDAGHVVAGSERTVTLPAGGGGSTTATMKELIAAAGKEIPILLSSLGDATGEVSQILKSLNLKFNPATGTLYVPKVETVIDDGLVE